MSDTNKDQDETLAPEDNAAKEDTAEDAPVIEAAVADDEVPSGDTSETPEAVEKPAKKRGSRIIRPLIWLVAVVAIGFGAYLAGHALGFDLFASRETTAPDEGDTQQITRLENQLSAAQETLSELQDSIDKMQQGGGDTAADIDALRQDVEDRVGIFSSLPARISTLESAVASFAGVSNGARDTWLLAEAEYYMQIANAQLQLASNPQLAALAMRMADERILQLANPSLTDVRRAIANELAALDAMKKPDIEGATLTLASLARVVESLPLRPAPGVGPTTDEPAVADQSGVQRAWSSMKSALSGLVKVTPPDQVGPSILTPDGEYFLRNNIALQLQSARLALLRGEQAVFEQSIDDTRALLQEYFDTNSAQVASTLDTLAEIRGSVLTMSAPDISESLKLLRQFRTLSENPQ
jgi:uroporphyrin-3 C-methyltransferase